MIDLFSSCFTQLYYCIILRRFYKRNQSYRAKEENIDTIFGVLIKLQSINVDYSIRISVDE